MLSCRRFCPSAHFSLRIRATVFVSILHIRSTGCEVSFNGFQSRRDPTNKGPTSRDRLPQNQNGRTTHSLHGGSTTFDGLRTSGTQKIPACPPLDDAHGVPELQAGNICPEITNSSHTGRVHGEVASRIRDSPLSRKKLGTGHVSTDRFSVKKYGRTSHLMESGSCYDPTHKGPTSWDSLPANKHGTMTPAQRGSPTTVDGGRVSGTQDMHACPPAFWREIGFRIACRR